jgi:hypothetical protein
MPIKRFQKAAPDRPFSAGIGVIEASSVVGVASDQGRENLALGFGSIGTRLPHLMQTTTRRNGRREINPSWPHVHLSRTSIHSLYVGGREWSTTQWSGRWHGERGDLLHEG